jgi:hypothetical protein
MPNFAHFLKWRRALGALVISLFLAVGLAKVADSGTTSLPERNLNLFVLAGQSNMAGRATVEPQDRLIIPHVYAFNKEMTWAPAVDPLHFDDPKRAGAGLGRTFAKVLEAANPSLSIGLIPCAVGATSLAQWQRGGKLYADTVRRTREAMKWGKLRGILWHQGEGESLSERDAATYITRWSGFIHDLRADLDAPDVPVVVGELCESLYHRPNGRSRFALIVNEQLAMIPLSVPHTGFASSAGLKDRGDFVHFDTPSVRELGRRYGYAFLALDPTWAPLN